MIQKDQIWTLAGQSGAGKSTLLNKLEREANQATGAISTALNRGKHTTRQVKLLNMHLVLLQTLQVFQQLTYLKLKLMSLEIIFMI